MKTHLLFSLTVGVLLMLTGCSGSDPASQMSDTSFSSLTTVSDPTQVDAVSTGTDTELSIGTSTGEEPARVSEEDRIVFLEAINAARAQTQDCGEEGIFEPAPPLSWNDRLANAAYEHSYDMAYSDTFSHDGSGTRSDETAQFLGKDGGSTYRERIEYHGYRMWRWIGENIAAGYVDPYEVVDAWIASPHHCSNLMDPDFTEVGMARVDRDGSHYRSYWSQEFGTR